MIDIEMRKQLKETMKTRSNIESPDLIEIDLNNDFK